MGTHQRAALPAVLCLAGPGDCARLLVTRRHVDLQRVSSALCPGVPACC